MADKEITDTQKELGSTSQPMRGKRILFDLFFRLSLIALGFLFALAANSFRPSVWDEYLVQHTLDVQTYVAVILCSIFAILSILIFLSAFSKTAQKILYKFFILLRGKTFFTSFSASSMLIFAIFFAKTADLMLSFSGYGLGLSIIAFSLGKWIDHRLSEKK